MRARNLGPRLRPERFDAIYPELAEKHGLVLYPFFLDGVAGDRRLNLPDGLHPTAKGVDVIVERHPADASRRFSPASPSADRPSARFTRAGSAPARGAARREEPCLMQYRRLGRTGLKVSLICLGTMTWGQQNTEAEGHAQMDYALEQGINFFDTAELYSIPPRAETQGSTERIIGTWFKDRGAATRSSSRPKVVGRSEQTGSATTARRRSSPARRSRRRSTRA